MLMSKRILLTLLCLNTKQALASTQEIVLIAIESFLLLALTLAFLGYVIYVQKKFKNLVFPNEQLKQYEIEEKKENRVEVLSFSAKQQKISEAEHTDNEENKLEILPFDEQQEVRAAENKDNAENKLDFDEQQVIREHKDNKFAIIELDETAVTDDEQQQTYHLHSSYKDMSKINDAKKRQSDLLNIFVHPTDKKYGIEVSLQNLRRKSVYRKKSMTQIKMV